MNDIEALQHDTNLREAVGRREQKRPAMPDGLNDRLLQRMKAADTAPQTKARTPWLRALRIVSSVAALWLAGLFFVVNSPFDNHESPAEAVHGADIASRPQGSTLKNVYTVHRRQRLHQQINYTQLRKMLHENK